MKKWLSAGAVVILCLALMIGIACGGEEEEEEVKTLKFGLGLPLSGAGGAIAGWPYMWTTEIYQDWYPEFEVSGQRYRWEFICEDSMPGGGTSLAGAHAAATKLIYDRGVDFLLMTPIDAVLVAAAITEEIGMIMLAPVCPMFSIGPEFPHTFINLQVWDLEVIPFFDWVTTEHPEVKSVVMTHSEDRMGQALKDGVKACCDYYGLELHAETTYTGMVEYYPVAAKLMTHDPDLVVGNLSLFQAMWDMGYEGLCACYFWSLAGGAVPWDKAAGKLFIYCPHALEEPWPEVARLAAEFEDRFGSETTPAILVAFMAPQVMTQAFQKAGTVTDMDRIIEVLETETFDTVMGTVHFGGEEIIGIPHVLMQPQPIWRAVGPGEYEVVKVYTAEELEALAKAVYAGR